MTTTNPNPAITVAVADDHRRGGISIHRPGCRHLRSLDLIRERVMTRDELVILHLEAAELNTASPVAPCLRREVTR